MSEKMTKEEMMSMAGTEFDYIFEDGDKMKSYVKLVDVDNERLSLWSFGLFTEDKYRFTPGSKEEINEQAICVSFADDINSMEIKLSTIRETGEWGRDNEADTFGFFHGCPF
jgi:hypothetical protein